jgi:hypothetical protein
VWQEADRLASRRALRAAAARRLRCGGTASPCYVLDQQLDPLVVPAFLRAAASPPSSRSASANALTASSVRHGGDVDLAELAVEAGRPRPRPACRRGSDGGGVRGEGFQLLRAAEDEDGDIRGRRACAFQGRDRLKIGPEANAYRSDRPSKFPQRPGPLRSEAGAPPSWARSTLAASVVPRVPDHCRSR